MNEDLIGPAATISILAVVLSLALLHGTHKAQEIQEAWRKLADRHRLRFEPPRRVLHWPEVAGSVAGRPFLLKKAGGGKHARFYMELGLRGDLPAGLKMKPSGRHVTAHLEVLGVPVSKLKEGGREVQINDEIKVTATDAGELDAYLSAARKHAALLLADLGGELDERKLRVTVTKTADDLEALDKAVRGLASVAPVLDLSPSK